MESDAGRIMMREILAQTIATKLSVSTRDIAKALAVMSAGKTPEERAATVQEGIRLITEALPEMVEELSTQLRIKMDEAKTQVKHE